jgi:DNA polymerase I-like protein with 3'-5' exonuclease and polymerase domains
MSNALAIDTENNTWNKGNPFDRRFKNICYSWASSKDTGAAKTDENSIAELANRVGQADILVGFNFKYDLHVLRKLGVDWGDKPIWCCQVAEFILSNQTWRYPSLDESCARYGLGTKIDVIAEKYWKNGIQTEDIPWNELAEYAEQDARLTLSLYQRQQECMSPQQKRLCRLQCMDLLILEEMEWNGIRFDHEVCDKRAQEIEQEIKQITDELSGIYPGIPINFGSGDQLSAFLYGGTITTEGQEHIGFFKTGERAGQPKYKKVEIGHELPRLVEPLRGSELKKPGVFATNADTLLKLRPRGATKRIIELIQRQVRLDSLLTKTYRGLLNANVNGNWEQGMLHGQFNQCVAQTGRLSSSNPNLQNLDGAAQDIFISRFND